LDLAMEGRGGGRDEGVADVGLELQGNVERRRERALDQGASDICAQRLAVEVGLVGSTEHDWNPRKQRLSVLQEEVEGRPHDGDDEVGSCAGIFASKMVGEHAVV